MKNQAFNFKSLLILSCMTVLFFGFNTPEVTAATPKQALKGALPIPGTSLTSNFLTLSQHGTVLENDDATLIWQEVGKLVLYWCDSQKLWETKTGGRGNLLVFDGNTGRLEIKDQEGNVIWTTNKDGGEKLELQDNRKLVMLDRSNSTLWKANYGFRDLNTSTAVTLSTYSIYDFMVPKTATYPYLYIHAEGADGGKRQVKEIDGSTRFTVDGGSGASIAAVFEIGTGTNQIPPGSSVRFILGEKGETETGQGTSGCDGGGGTGVLYKRPNDSKWRLLIVAGGGGGAYSDCCTAKSVGRSAEITENGGDGACSGCSSNGGTNGNAGESNENYSTDAGKGIKWVPGSLSLDCSNGKKGYTSWLEEDEDRTRLPAGTICYGTFGFGGGGEGYQVPGVGGGGGGYSGGGPGKSYAAGGGGGSYLNSDMAKDSYKIKNPSTSDTKAGFVRYQFINSPQISKAVKFTSNTDKCIDDQGSGTSNGTNIQTYTCTGNSNQQWYIIQEDRTIRSKLNTTKCLDLDHSNTANGANIQLWDCNVSSAQKWLYNGIHQTVHSGINSDKCLDAKGGIANKDQNVNIQLWDCKYANNGAQQWEIEGATTVSDLTKVKHIVPAVAPDFAVHSHTGAESGSNIQLWSKDNSNSYEQWSFDGLAIRMRDHQNLCVDLNQSSTANGTNIQLYNCNETDAQKWIYDGMTQTMRSVVNPDKCMQIGHNADGVYGKRSNVQINDCNGSNAQLFLIQE